MKKLLFVFFIISCSAYQAIAQDFEINDGLRRSKIIQSNKITVDIYNHGTYTNQKQIGTPAVYETEATGFFSMG